MRNNFDKTSRKRRRTIRIASRRSVADVEQQCAVANRARHHVTDCHTAPAFARVGTERCSRTRRLESDEAAARSRNPDRSAAVGRMGDWNDAGSDRGRGTAARAARGARQIPWIATRTQQHGFGRRGQSDFRRVGFAEHHQTGFAIASHDLRVMVRDELVPQAAPETAPHTLHKVQVLDEEGDAAQFARNALARDFKSLVEHRRDDGIDFRIDRLRTRDRSRRHVLRAHISIPNEIGQRRRVLLQVVALVHRMSPRRKCPRASVISSPDFHITAQQSR